MKNPKYTFLLLILGLHINCAFGQFKNVFEILNYVENELLQLKKLEPSKKYNETKQRVIKSHSKADKILKKLSDKAKDTTYIITYYFANTRLRINESEFLEFTKPEVYSREYLKNDLDVLIQIYLDPRNNGKKMTASWLHNLTSDMTKLDSDEFDNLTGEDIKDVKDVNQKHKARIEKLEKRIRDGQKKDGEKKTEGKKKVNEENIDKEGSPDISQKDESDEKIKQEQPTQKSEKETKLDNEEKSQSTELADTDKKISEDEPDRSEDEKSQKKKKVTEKDSDKVKKEKKPKESKAKQKAQKEKPTKQKDTQVIDVEKDENLTENQAQILTRKRGKECIEELKRLKNEIDELKSQLIGQLENEINKLENEDNSAEVMSAVEYYEAEQNWFKRAGDELVNEIEENYERQGKSSPKPEIFELNATSCGLYGEDWQVDFVFGYEKRVIEELALGEYENQCSKYALNYFVKLLKEFMTKKNLKSRDITGHIIGFADGALIGNRKYDGGMGDINIPYIYRNNGDEDTLILTKSKKIQTNRNLATLRGYNAFKKLRDSSIILQENINIYSQVMSMTGGRYRRIEIMLYIKGANKEALNKLNDAERESVSLIPSDAEEVEYDKSRKYNPYFLKYRDFEHIPMRRTQCRTESFSTQLDKFCSTKKINIYQEQYYGVNFYLTQLILIPEEQTKKDKFNIGYCLYFKPDNEYFELKVLPLFGLKIIPKDYYEITVSHNFYELVNPEIESISNEISTFFQ